MPIQWERARSLSYGRINEDDGDDLIKRVMRFE